MKKIYWLIQQTKKPGGSELVSTQIANRLVNDYDITIIVMGEKPDNCYFDINPKIKLRYLGIKERYIRLDEELSKKKRERKYFSFIGVILSTGFFWLFKRNKYKKELKEMTTEDDLIIASSLDNYAICPKKRKVYFHIHFNSKFFLKRSNRLMMGLFTRKPDKYIFLSKMTEDEVKKKYPRINSCYNTNICRFEREQHFEYKGGKLLFIGRYADQKRPLLLLQAMNELKKRNIEFHLDMYGNGPLEDLMKRYIKDNALENNVTINPQSTDIKNILHEHDILLLTSSYEGYPLVVQEAASQSIPTISMDWGEPLGELVIDDISGYITKDSNIYQFAERIQMTLGDPKKLSILKEKTYEFASHYSQEAIINKWKTIIESK